jgi:hypothetical protein
MKMTKNVRIIKCNSDAVEISDSDKNYTATVNISLFRDNGINIESDTIEISDTMYNDWFKECINKDKTEQHKKAMYLKTIAEYKIRQFCKEHYGTAFPGDIGFGHIFWSHVPAFARLYSANHIANIPYIRPLEAVMLYEQWCNEKLHEQNAAEFRKNIEEWHERIDKFPDKCLTAEQLAMLGIDFDPYETVGLEKTLK